MPVPENTKFHLGFSSDASSYSLDASNMAELVAEIAIFLATKYKGGYINIYIDPDRSED